MSDLSTKQVAERLNVTRQQVGLWCRRGLLAGAYEQDSGRGPVWRIPEAALEGFTPPKPTGRPPRAKAEGESKTKRGRDSGPAGDDRPGERRETIASQTKTTRRLDQAVKRDADSRMAGKQKAISRWEGEGGATPPTKKGGKK